MKITIPENMSEITLRQYLDYQKVMKSEGITEEFEMLATVTIFCRLSVEQAKSIPLKELKDISKHIAEIMSKPPRFFNTFTLDKVRYGFIPNLDEMTAGEYIDLDKYFSDEEKFCNAMAIMYRPVNKSVGNSYTIEPYESSEKYRKQMESASIEVFLGAQVFFYNLSRKLLVATSQYLKSPKIQEEVSQMQDSAQSGDGIRAYTRYLEATFSSSIQQHQLEFTNS